MNGKGLLSRSIKPYVPNTCQGESLNDSMQSIMVVTPTIPPHSNWSGGGIMIVSEIVSTT